MKTIKSLQVTYLPLTELAPGMVVTEGIVTSVQPPYGTFTTAAGLFEAVDPDRIAVLCRIDDAMLDALYDALDREPLDAGRRHSRT